MKIEVSENRNIILSEVYSPIGLKTNDNETLIIMMRDSGFEIIYENKFFHLKKGEIKSEKQRRQDEQNKWYNKHEDENDTLFEF